MDLLPFPFLIYSTNFRFLLSFSFFLEWKVCSGIFDVQTFLRWLWLQRYAQAEATFYTIWWTFLCVKLLLFSVAKVFARDELQPSYDSVDQCASSIYAFSFALVCDDIFKNTHAWSSHEYRNWERAKCIINFGKLCIPNCKAMNT